MENFTNLNDLESISMDELQSQLITWVQEKGLLNELRAYLRKKMIFLLKDTVLDQKTCVINQLCVTPKLQAISLLVAEYLLSQQLFYSLSVFSTEVPTITHVNKFCLQIQNSNDKNQKSPKLDSSEILHILEALGIPSQSTLQEKIISAYTKATDRKVSLLACIAETISTSSFNSIEKKIEKFTQGSNTDEQFDSSRNINTVADLNLLFEDCYLKKYQKSVFMFMEKEQNRVKAEERARYRSRLYKSQKNLYHQMKVREECVLQKLSEAEKHLISQKHDIEANLKRKQGKLQELADELNIIHAQLTSREAVVQEAVLVLKSNSKSNLCENCENLKNVQKKRSSKSKLSSGDDKNSQENTPSSRGVAADKNLTETACERRLFSDIILGLQQENAGLREQTLRHQSSIIKLKAKLSKKKSYGCSRQSLVQQLYVPLPEVCRPCNNQSSKNSTNSPKTSSPEKEKKVSSKTSVKSDAVSQESQSIEEQHLVKSTSSEKSSLKKSDSKELRNTMKETKEHKKSPKVSSQGDGGYDFIRPFVPEHPKLKPKPGTKSKLEVQQKSAMNQIPEAQKTVKSQENSEVHELSRLERQIKHHVKKEVQNIKDNQKRDARQNIEDHQQDIEDRHQRIEARRRIEEKKIDQQIRQELQRIEDEEKMENEQRLQDQHEIENNQKMQYQEQNQIHQGKGDEPKIDVQTDRRKLEVKLEKICDVKSPEKKHTLPIQMPNVILDTDMIENAKECFKDIDKKMKPLEDRVLYSKRFPNIYYPEPCADSSSHGDRNQNCAKCHLENKKKLGDPIRRNVDLETHPDYCCSRSTYEIAGVKFCRLNPNLKRNESEESFRSESSKSSNLPRNRRHRTSHFNPENIAAVDENVLFEKVCTSLGVPFSPISNKDSHRSEKINDRMSNKRKSSFKQEDVFKKNKNRNVPNTLLDESSLSTCSENSKDCLTPDSLFLELDGSSLASS